MNIILKRFPWLIVKPIQGCKETRQLFLLPGVLVGKGYFTIFWIRTMLTVNFNTTFIKDDNNETR